MGPLFLLCPKQVERPEDEPTLKSIPVAAPLERRFVRPEAGRACKIRSTSDNKGALLGFSSLESRVWRLASVVAVVASEPRSSIHLLEAARILPLQSRHFERLWRPSSGLAAATT